MQMYFRFVSATHYCISRVMSAKRFVPDMALAIHIFMDAMVEFDRWLLQVKEKADLQEATHADVHEPTQAVVTAPVDRAFATLPIDVTTATNNRRGNRNRTTKRKKHVPN
jgi:hypothetical protein